MTQKFFISLRPCVMAFWRYQYRHCGFDTEGDPDTDPEYPIKDSQGIALAIDMPAGS